MGGDDELSALVALARTGGRAWVRYSVSIRDAGDARAISPEAVLEQELGLLAYGAQARASAEVASWRERGYHVVSMLSEEYPANLRSVANRPPLLFVAGRLDPGDRRAVAIIGTRQPSEAGRQLAAALAAGLGTARYVVFSGLARGIDAAAHIAALDLRRRTVAVLGTGLAHSYPPEHAALQQRIADTGALVSQFWPESPPTRRSFPARNAVMAGLTLASVIVEASPHSGTRIQARHALSQGRAVILMGPAMRETWAQELAERPGVAVAQTPGDVVGILER